MVCQDLSDTSWLSLQENSIYTANDEQSPTLVWLGTGSLCNEIHCGRFFRALIRFTRIFTVGLKWNLGQEQSRIGPGAILDRSAPCTAAFCIVAVTLPPLARLHGSEQGGMQRY